MPKLERGELLRLFETVQPGLVLYARNWLDEAAAQDIVQQAFVKLHLQRAAPVNPKAWLYAVVRRKTLDAVRSRSRRSRHEGCVGASRSEVLSEPADALVRRDEVTAALTTLETDEREAVVLRVWSGLTLEEIGDVIGCSTATALRRYQAGLGRIRSFLEGTCQRDRKKITMDADRRPD